MLGSADAQRQSRPIPGEVISDPLSDTDDRERIDPNIPHTVLCFFLIDFC